MSWAFPNRRLLPVLGSALAYLVLCTAQRGALLSIVRHETQASPHDALRAMVLGTQADLAVAAAVLLPFALWALVLPERAWRSRVHRAALNTGLAVAHAAMMTFLVVESLYFLAHRTRVGPGSGERLRAMVGFVLGTRGGAPAIIGALVIVALSIVTVGLLHRLVRRGFEGPRSAVGARVRDLLLHGLALGLLCLLVASREPEFPGRRSLQELTGNGMMRAARVGWGRLPPRARAILPWSSTK